MQLFKLSATESTNQYLKNLASNIDLEDNTIEKKEDKKDNKNG